MPQALQIPLDLGSRTAQGRDDFLVAKCNAAAVAWIDRWPGWTGPFLILHGPASCGKTHLGAVWRVQADAKTIDPEDLARHSAEHIAARSHHLLIDGLSPWPAGDAAAETALFHLYNMFKEQGRSALLTMRMAPQTADYRLPDLASRLRAAPSVRIAEPDDEILSGILVKLFYDRQIPVGADVIHYILPRMERSFAAAHTLVETADRLALSLKKPVTVALLRDILGKTPNI